jgi:integrase
MPAKSNLRLVAPTHQNRTVPSRTTNASYRKREHLTPAEVEKLIEAAKGNRYGHRDATMILLAFRHGLRASELCDLEWSQVDWNAATLHVRRAKNGKPATHPIRGDEMRVLRQLQRDQDPKSAFVFASERGTPFTPDAINRLVKRLGDGSKLLGFSASRLPASLPHAASLVRLRARQCRPRYAGHSGLLRPQGNPAHGSIYRACTDEVQILLALVLASTGDNQVTTGD